MAANPYEAARREEKASAIARVLRDIGADPEVVPHLDEEGRRTVEAAAGTKPGSAETWRLAIVKLEAMQAVGRGPLALPEDPLEGLPKGPRSPR